MVKIEEAKYNGTKFSQFTVFKSLIESLKYKDTESCWDKCTASMVTMTRITLGPTPLLTLFLEKRSRLMLKYTVHVH